MNRRIAALAVALAATGVMVAGCTSSSASKAQKAQNSLAGTEVSEFSAAVPYPFAHQAPSDPLERKNLAARLLAQNSKGSTAYVYILAPLDGKPIGYYVIKGKVSSTGSEMTSTDINVDCSTSNTNAACTNLAIGDDGSYGMNEGGQNGVFFFTSSGVLVETTLPWISSNAPIKLYATVPQLDAAAQ
jgi:hypothetical protein